MKLTRRFLIAYDLTVQQENPPVSNSIGMSEYVDTEGRMTKDFLDEFCKRKQEIVRLRSPSGCEVFVTPLGATLMEE